MGQHCLDLCLLNLICNLTQPWQEEKEFPEVHTQHRGIAPAAQSLEITTGPGLVRLAVQRDGLSVQARRHVLDGGRSRGGWHGLVPLDCWALQRRELQQAPRMETRRRCPRPVESSGSTHRKSLPWIWCLPALLTSQMTPSCRHRPSHTKCENYRWQAWGPHPPPPLPPPIKYVP